MTARAQLTYLPRLLGEAEAARYLGVCQTTLRNLGLPRRVLGARRLYDRHDLDAAADAMPYEGGDSAGAAEWDRVYGIAR